MNHQELIERVAANDRYSRDWQYQQRECAVAIAEAEHERALVAVAIGLYHSPAFQRVMRAEIQRRTAPRSYAVPSTRPESGMIYRNGRTIDLAQMQANLVRNNRRLEELRRQVQRERAGYR